MTVQQQQNSFSCVCWIYIPLRNFTHIVRTYYDLCFIGKAQTLWVNFFGSTILNLKIRKYLNKLPPPHVLRILTLYNLVHPSYTKLLQNFFRKAILYCGMFYNVLRLRKLYGEATYMHVLIFLHNNSYGNVNNMLASHYCDASHLSCMYIHMPL